MIKPVACIEVYCDGCGERYEWGDFTAFSEDWPFDEDDDWCIVGDVALCTDCRIGFERMVESIAEGDE